MSTQPVRFTFLRIIKPAMEFHRNNRVGST
jgi:hypothetical protein